MGNIRYGLTDIRMAPVYVYSVHKTPSDNKINITFTVGFDKTRQISAIITREASRMKYKIMYDTRQRTQIRDTCVRVQRETHITHARI